MKKLFFSKLILIVSLLILSSCTSSIDKGIEVLEHNKVIQMNSYSISEINKMTSELKFMMSKKEDKLTKKEFYSIYNKYDIANSTTRSSTTYISTESDYDDFFSAPDDIQELLETLGEKEKVFFEIISNFILCRSNYDNFDDYRAALVGKINNRELQQVGIEIIETIEKEKELLQYLDKGFSNGTRARLRPCDYFAAGAGVIIGDLAIKTGFAAAVGGPIGLGVGLTGSIIGALGGLAYYAAFC